MFSSQKFRKNSHKYFNVLSIIGIFFRIFLDEFAQLQRVKVAGVSSGAASAAIQTRISPIFSNQKF